MGKLWNSLKTQPLIIIILFIACGIGGWIFDEAVGVMFGERIADFIHNNVLVLSLAGFSIYTIRGHLAKLTYCAWLAHSWVAFLVDSTQIVSVLVE